MTATTTQRDTALPTWMYSRKTLGAVIESFRQGRYYYVDGVEDDRTRVDRYVDASNMMDFWVSQHLRRPSQDLRLQRPVWNLIGSVEKSKAVAFKEMPTVELMDPLTQRAALSKDYAVVRRLSRILDDSGIMAAMEEAEGISVSHQASVVEMRQVEGEVVPTALPPFCADATGHPAAPGDLRRLKRMEIPEGGYSYPERPTEELRRVYERRFVDGRALYLAGLVDPKGAPLDYDLEGVTDGVVDAGVMPVVIWREREAPKPFPALPLALHNAAVNLNLWLAQMALAYRMGTYVLLYLKKVEKSAGAFPQLDTTNYKDLFQQAAAQGGAASAAAAVDMKPLEITVPGDIHELMYVPPGWDVGSVQPRVQIEELIRFVEAMLKLAYVHEDLNPSEILLARLPANYSGQAKIQDAVPLEGARQRRERRLRRQAVQTLRTWRAFHNRRCAPEDFIPWELDFRVTFQSLWSPSAILNESTARAFTELGKNGLISFPAIRASIDDVPYDEGVERWKRDVGRQGWIASTTAPDGPASSAGTPAATGDETPPPTEE